MLYTLGRIQKTRAKMQTTSSLETKEATVYRTYSNGVHVIACDVRVKGQQKTLFEIPNGATANWSIGDTVLVNLTWGNSNRPKIIGAAGATTSNSAADASNGLINGGSNGGGSTSLMLAGIPFLLESASTIAAGGFVVEPGANVVLTPTSPAIASGGLTDGFLTIAAKRLVLTSLPPITGLLDGTLLDLVDSYGVGLGMYRLSTSLGKWVREDVGSSSPLIDQPLLGTVDGFNTSFTLPRLPSSGFEIFADGARWTKTFDYSIGLDGLTITTVIAPNSWAHANIF